MYSITINQKKFKGKETTKTYDAANVEGIGAFVAGETANDAVGIYKYDEFNQLIEARENGQTATYGYNGDSPLMLCELNDV